MIVTNLLGEGLFMSALSAIGLLLAHATSPEAPPDPPAADAPEAAIDPRVARLRAVHRVTLIGESQEGSSVAQLAGGVCGFTYAPQEAAPLFGKKMYHNFEIHKLHDGSLHLVGFVTEAEALQLEAGGAMAFNLYPDPYAQAVNAVSVPVARVTKTRGPARDFGNALHLQLAAADASPC